jgi:hypothetical protein
MTIRMLLTALLAVTIGSGSFFVVSAEAARPGLSASAGLGPPNGLPPGPPDGVPPGPPDGVPPGPPDGVPSNSPSTSAYAPEIDPGMARAGLIILAGGLMMLVDRYRRR